MEQPSLHEKLFDNFIWGLKYRPKYIDELILPERIISYLKNIVKGGRVPNLLLSGSPGNGKSSVASVLAGALDLEYLYINASEQTGIDVLRTNIRQFITSKSWDGNNKVVIMDECLWEEESIITGTIEEPEELKLKDFNTGQTYPLISFNMETGEFQNDTGEIISEREEDVFEVILDDDYIIYVTKDHPFIVKLSSGKFIEKSISDGLGDYDEVVVMASDTTDLSETSCVRRISSIGTKKVRNLNVNKNHTFINSQGIVTHNCDRASGQFQDALKSTLEQFSKSCSFIFISNHKNKIIEPLQSRLQTIEFKFTLKETKVLQQAFFKRCLEILKEEKVEYSNKVVAHIIKNIFPDMRKVLNELQKLSQQDALNDMDTVNNILTDVVSYYNILKKRNYKDLLTYIAQSGNDPSGFYSSLFESAVKYVEGDSLPDFIILLGKYSYEAAFVSDSRINMTAFSTESMLNCAFKNIDE